MTSVLIAELSQETNTFCPLQTDMTDFMPDGTSLLTGDALIDAYKGTNTVLGGMLEGCVEHGWRVIPSLGADAYPSGVVTRRCYEALRDLILQDLRRTRPDAVLLSLHGAMVAEGYHKPESDVLARVREVVGPRVPIIGVLDLHGNISMDMLSAADVLIGYTEYPHTDTGARGLEASRILASLITSEFRPAAAVVPVPALLISMNMRTNHGPMAEMFRLARDLERRQGVVDVSVFGGFPYADIPEAGASVLCTTRGDPALARQCAAEAAEELWERRHAFAVRAATAEDAVLRAIASARDARGPLVLADVSDNPASGGVGDHPHLLRTALERGVRNAVASLFYDPDTVAQAVEVGAGGSAEFRLGGKVGADVEPIAVRATVRGLSDGRFTIHGPMNRGLKINIGRTARLSLIAGPNMTSPAGAVDVLVAERRHSTDDPEMLRMLGIEPVERDVLILKSKGHFRAAFGPIVREIVDVDTGGVATLDLQRLQFRHVRRPIFPLDDVVWSA